MTMTVTRTRTVLSVLIILCNYINVHSHQDHLGIIWYYCIFALEDQNKNKPPINRITAKYTVFMLHNSHGTVDPDGDYSSVTINWLMKCIADLGPVSVHSYRCWIIIAVRCRSSIREQMATIETRLAPSVRTYRSTAVVVIIIRIFGSRSSSSCCCFMGVQVCRVTARCCSAVHRRLLPNWPQTNGLGARGVRQRTSKSLTIPLRRRRHLLSRTMAEQSSCDDRSCARCGRGRRRGEGNFKDVSEMQCTAVAHWLGQAAVSQDPGRLKCKCNMLAFHVLVMRMLSGATPCLVVTGHSLSGWGPAISLRWQAASCCVATICAGCLSDAFGVVWNELTFNCIRERGLEILKTS